MTKAGLTKREADEAVDAVVEVVGGTLGAAERVRVEGAAHPLRGDVEQHHMSGRHKQQQRWRHL